MLNENRKILLDFRLEQAYGCLKEANIMIEADAYKGAANRSYYCIFHAMRAMLALDGFDSKKHSGIISKFREKYIKTNVFPKEFSGIIKQSYNNRGKCDYDDFFVISKEETTKQLDNAKTFLSAVEAYIETLGVETAEK